MREKPSVPIWHKQCLTIDEAVAYSEIGRQKIVELTERPDCNFLLMNGTKRLIKRVQFDEYISKKSVL